jgi:hypothetical protein
MSDFPKRETINRVAVCYDDSICRLIDQEIPMNRIPFFLAAALGTMLLACERTPAENEKKEPTKKELFAQDRVEQGKEIDFDAKRAMEYLETLCKIGPRLSGSDGMKQQQELLTKHFEKFGGKVSLQEFKGKQPSRNEAVAMANMIVTWRPETKKRILLCGHYDTRPIADQEQDRRNWNKPFVSANDGTSTVAFFMELAHHMKEMPLNVGVDFILFDAEEYIYEPQRDKFFLGSDHFAAEYKKNPPGHKYHAGVLLDLFAGKNATFPVEENSRFLAGPLVEEIWVEARRLGVKRFEFKQGPEVLDDHMALNRVGIPTIDIIDFEYRHWHKLSDLPEACSGESMKDVARVVTSWMMKQK